MEREATEVWPCLLRALSEVAWADGVLRPAEAEFFVEVISRLGLPTEEALASYRSVLAPGEVEDSDVSLLDNDDRRWLLGFGYLMAAADGEVADTEIATLRIMASRLGISWADAEQLFADAESVRERLPQPNPHMGAVR